MQSLLNKTKGLIYSLMQETGILRFPLWILNSLLCDSCIKLALKLSSFNLKMPVPVRVATMEADLKKIKLQKAPVSCLIIGGWALEGYPKLIASYLPKNSSLKCVDTYGELEKTGYRLSHSEGISRKYALIAFLLALKNIRSIKYRANLNISLIYEINIFSFADIYDLVFIDTSGPYKIYERLLKDSYLSLRDGGIIIGDDFEVQLPIQRLLLEECKESIDHDLIYSKVIGEYVHPGIVLGLNDFMLDYPNAQVESNNGIYIIHKNSKRLND